MNQATIRVAIAEDQRLFRECLVSILNATGHLQVVGEAANGKELLQRLATLQPLPDVALLDLTMPDMNGLETTQHLKRDFQGGAAPDLPRTHHARDRRDALPQRPYGGRPPQ